jgi:hypothetical protein
MFGIGVCLRQLVCLGYRAQEELLTMAAVSPYNNFDDVYSRQTELLFANSIARPPWRCDCAVSVLNDDVDDMLQFDILSLLLPSLLLIWHSLEIFNLGDLFVVVMSLLLFLLLLSLFFFCCRCCCFCWGCLRRC